MNFANSTLGAGDRFYCGHTGHSVQSCPDRDEDLRTGKIAMSAQAKLVTADGSPIPGGLPTKDAVCKNLTTLYELELINEVVFEPEGSGGAAFTPSSVRQLYHAPRPGQIQQLQQATTSSQPAPKSMTDERLDRLTANLDKSTSFMAGTMLNTRSREYEDVAPSEK